VDQGNKVGNYLCIDKQQKLAIFLKGSSLKARNGDAALNGARVLKDERDAKVSGRSAPDCAERTRGWSGEAAESLG